MEALQSRQALQHAIRLTLTSGHVPHKVGERFWLISPPDKRHWFVHLAELRKSFRMS